MSDLSKLSNAELVENLRHMAEQWSADSWKAKAVREAASRLQAPAVAEVEERRCEHCDGTGDVIRIDGEWLGECPCGAAALRTGGSE